ncbi:MAG: hypothetical protein KME47_18180 [Nodosilinea sp. WJT8-NPBG4]|nr:hypothetical protein [Nodosilinea sp. WJT8-NPBG4]
MLTIDQVNTIKGCLHPETVIREKPVTSSSVPEGVKLPVGSNIVVPLDLDQERLARNMKDGHRLISGVAGSGKTLILLARAKVAGQPPTQPAHPYPVLQHHAGRPPAIAPAW